MKYLVLILVSSFCLLSCYTTNESQKCPEDVFCTLDFRMITIEVVDADKESIALDAYKVVQLSNNQDITPVHDLNSLQKGFYTLATDGSIEKGATEELLFLGYVNNQEIVRSTFQVTHDCCHINLVLGATTLVVSDATLSCNIAAFIDADAYANAPNDDLKINSIELSGDCLTIHYSASGCSGDSWELQLIGAVGTTKSIPPQRTIRLSLKDDEDCEAFITRSISFDIANFQMEGFDEVVLNIQGYDDQVSYQY